MERASRSIHSDHVDLPSANLLDQHLAQLCSKARFLELIHDFIVFDAGTKKPAAITSISASVPPRLISAAGMAASSGTPKAAARA